MRGYLQPELLGLQQLFTNCVMSIPEYQRSYAWERRQWEDLWSDVSDGLESGTDHFLSTVVLRESNDHRMDARGRVVRVFDVVDGQQRLTTLVLLLLALFDQFRDEPIGVGIWLDFIEQDGIARLELGGTNNQYFKNVVDAVRSAQGIPRSPRTTNARIEDCLSFFRDKLNAFKQVTGALKPEEFVAFIRERLRLLRFVTDNEALAIKTFQAVNDRGKPLTLLDKTKSLFMFNIIRYVNGDDDLFNQVQDAFGQIYESFDQAMDLARSHGVQYLINPRYRFGEEELLNFTYHHSALHLIKRYGLTHAYAYSLGAEKVYEDFLKRTLYELRKQQLTLKSFIAEFMEDFVTVAQSLTSLLSELPSRSSLSNLLQRQGLNASVYPLLIGLKAREMLDEKMLQAISVLDLRVYKVRGTDPRADLYKKGVSVIRDGISYESIYSTIVGFTRFWGSDAALDGYLRQGVYRQPYVPFILSEMVTVESGKPDDSFSEVLSVCQVDHILPQKPMVDVTTCGFASDDEYFSEINKFGNLCLLEQRLNGGAANVPLAIKAGYYIQSDLKATRVLGHMLKETGFRREDIGKRLETIIAFFREHWPIPAGETALIPEENDDEEGSSTSSPSPDSV